MLVPDIAQIIAIVHAVGVVKDMCGNKISATNFRKKNIDFLYERFTKQKRFFQTSCEKNIANFRICFSC